MDVYEISVDLRPGVRDLDFVAALERYLGALEREIELAAESMPAGLPLKHLHFGGGSPTLVPPRRMLALMDRPD